MKIKYKLLLITFGLILLPMAISTGVVSFVVQNQNDSEAWARIDGALQLVLDDIELRANTLAKRMRVFSKGEGVSDTLKFFFANQRAPGKFSQLKKVSTRLAVEMHKFASSAEFDRIFIYFPDGRLVGYFWFVDGDTRFSFVATNGEGKLIRLFKECRPRQNCQPIPWQEQPIEEWPISMNVRFDGAPRVVESGKAFSVEISKAVKIATPRGINKVIGPKITIHKHFDSSFAQRVSDLTGTDVAFFTANRTKLSPTWNAQGLPDGFLAGLQPGTIHHQELMLETRYYAGFRPFTDDGGRVVGVVTARFSADGTRAKTREAVSYLIGIAVLSILIMVPVALFLSHRFVGPIYQLTDGVKSFGKGDLSSRIPEEGTDEIGELAAAFNSMAGSIEQAQGELEHLNQELDQHNKDLEQKIAQAVSAIQELMDNTGQGVFAFGRDYQVYRYYSRPCLTFFEGSLENLDALDLMFGKPSLTANALRALHDGGDLESFTPATFAKELIDLVFNGETTFAFLKELLPQEFQKGEQIFSVEFHLIPGSHGRDDKVLVILTDITKERELALKVAEEEERNEILIRVALNRDGFIQFLGELESQFLKIYSELVKPPEAVVMDDLMRQYHTIKGEMATYGMTLVAEEIHGIESILVEKGGENDPLDNSILLEVINKTQDAQLTFGKYLDDLSSLISREDRIRSEEVFQVPASKISRLKEFVLGMLPHETLDDVKRAIEDLSKQPVEPMLRKLASTAKTVAARTNKHVRVEITGGDTEVLYNRLEGFFGVMGHLVRNCVDHGLDENETRKELSKPEVGTITIEASGQANSLTLIISDDGKGIDPDRILTAALQNNLIDINKVANLTRDQIINLIFEPGLSTKTEVSDVSGRGAGMDAVKVEIDRLNGDIQIKTKKDQGTTFEIHIPDVT